MSEMNGLATVCQVILRPACHHVKHSALRLPDLECRGILAYQSEKTMVSGDENWERLFGTVNLKICHAKAINRTNAYPP